MQERNIILSGCGNFRDLGGYQDSKGRSVRWRRLFRSDALIWLTSEDIETLASLDVKLVAGIDLRTHDEVAAPGSAVIYENGTQHHHLPFFPTFGEDRQRVKQVVYAVGKVAGEGYLGLLEQARPCFEGLFNLLADEANYPSAYYCAAGKDRTGMVSALLLRSLGVSDEQIVADYALTQAPSVERILTRLKLLGRDTDDLPDREALAAHPETMEHFLAGFDRLYGSVEDFLLASNVSDRTLDRVRQNLMED